MHIQAFNRQINKVCIIMEPFFSYCCSKKTKELGLFALTVSLNPKYARNNGLFCFLSRRSDYMAFEDKRLSDLHCVFLSMRDEIQRNKIHQSEHLTSPNTLSCCQKKEIQIHVHTSAKKELSTNW